MNAKPRSAYLLSIAAAAALAGCSSEVTYDDPRLEQIDAELVRAESCEDLEASLKEDALIKMHAQIDAQIAAIESYGYGYGYGDGNGNGYGDGYGDGYGFPEQEIGGARPALAAASAREGMSRLALSDVCALALGGVS